MVTEEVTEDSVRSADEDFETAVTGDVTTEEVETAVASDQGTVEERDSGLSNFQKALLLGLGAAAVGSILDNGDEVVSNTGDRVVVKRGQDLVVLKDDDALLRRPGAQVATRGRG